MRNVLLIVLALAPCLLSSYLWEYNVIVNDSFETSDFKKRWKTREACCEHSVTLSDSIARSGQRSIRFELRNSDRKIAGGKRSEIAIKAEKSSDIERWYAFSIFIPKNYHFDTSTEVVSQWHEVPDFDLGESWRTPPLALRIVNGQWMLGIKWANSPVNTNKTISGKKDVFFGDVNVDVWTDWIFHIKTTYKEDGIVEVFKNSKQIFKWIGPNYYNDRQGPFFKIGLYKASWNTYLSSQEQLIGKVVYFDDVVIADEQIDFSRMVRLIAELRKKNDLHERKPLNTQSDTD